MMTRAEAQRKAGGRIALARLLGVTPQAVSQWPMTDFMPQARVWQLRLLKPRWFRGKK